MTFIRDFAAAFGTIWLLLLAISFANRSSMQVQPLGIVVILVGSLAFAAIRAGGRDGTYEHPVRRHIRARGSGRRLAWKLWS